eukprot:923537_1
MNIHIIAINHQILAQLKHNNRCKHKSTFSSNTTLNTNGYNNTAIDSQLTNNTNITRISHSHTTRSSYASHNSNSNSNNNDENRSNRKNRSFSALNHGRSISLSGAALLHSGDTKKKKNKKI